MFTINRFVNVHCKCAHIHGTGLTFGVIGFTIWPDLPKMQLLNHAIRARPTLYVTLELNDIHVHDIVHVLKEGIPYSRKFRLSF